MGHTLEWHVFLRVNAQKVTPHINNGVHIPILKSVPVANKTHFVHRIIGVGHDGAVKPSTVTPYTGALAFLHQPLLKLLQCLEKRHSLFAIYVIGNGRACFITLPQPPQHGVRVYLPKPCAIS
ncbi:hypothetical protein D3C77_448310 [compost metagenome]